MTLECLRTTTSFWARRGFRRICHPASKKALRNWEPHESSRAVESGSTFFLLWWAIRKEQP